MEVVKYRDEVAAPPSQATRVNDHRNLWRRPVVWIVFLVLLANAAYVLGLANSDPLSWTSGVAHAVCGLVCGRSSIDINVGTITQPLAHRAALDLTHGHWPWWNYFEGLGQPLAGEMQSAALFPLSLLFALPAGLVWFHVTLEAIAGISTYLLLRRLRVPAGLCGAGGVLFALSGTFAWLANSVVNPVAFLAMLLLGVELIIDRASEDARRGWQLAALALALSLYAGFPEVAYFDALFCLAWALVRISSLPRARRPRVVRRLGLAGTVGVGLSLPALVPFADFLHVAFVGGHASAVNGSWSLSLKALPMLVDPYVYGTIYQNPHLSTVWGEIGGFFGTGVITLAIVGTLGRPLRQLRVLLAAWVVASLAGSFNILHARSLWNLVPLVGAASLPRYVMPSCELALIVLAILGVRDLAERARARQWLLGASVFMALVVLAIALGARPLNRGLTLTTSQRVLFALVGTAPFIVLGVLAVLSRFPTTAFTLVVVAATLVGESFLWFVVPTIAAPKSIMIDYAPINYLRAHQGEERFLDLSVLYPNWGSQFGLNSLNATDLPFPQSFKSYVQRDLYPGLKPADAFTRDRPSSVDAQEQELAAHFVSYEDASVKYLLAPSSLVLAPGLKTLGVHEVFRDNTATIYELPHPRPFFSTSSGCRVTSTGDNVAVVSCASSGTLLRTELSMKGWTADVNGHASAITTVNGVFQRVDVPAGTSTVTYQFLPPHEDEALIVGLLAGLFLVGSFLFEVRSRRRRVSKQGVL